MLKLQPNISNPRGFYEDYLVQMDSAFRETSGKLDKQNSNEQLASIALQLAISSYAQKLACEKILDILKEKEAPQKVKPK